MQALGERLRALAALSERQLFFVGGAPRSGTTWLQAILDAHPDVSCQGEALFPQHLAAPIDTAIATQRWTIDAKNREIFGFRAGYALPSTQDADLLIATGILLALERQAAGSDARAIGEKTPENLFFFPRLKRLFSNAKMIAILRDPRDVVTSAWHFFPREAARDDVAALTDFVEMALPSLIEGTRSLLEFGRDEKDLLVVTFEALKAKPASVVKKLYDFLGVASDAALVADCVERISFEAMTTKHPATPTGDGSFFRKGVVGAWETTLPPRLAERIANEAGLAFEIFGWHRSNQALSRNPTARRMSELRGSSTS